MYLCLHGPLPVLLCSRCGIQVQRGESYWYLNGAVICADCLPEFARGELEPFRRVRGEEEFL